MEVKEQVEAENSERAVWSRRPQVLSSGLACSRQRWGCEDYLGGGGGSRGGTGGCWGCCMGGALR